MDQISPDTHATGKDDVWVPSTCYMCFGGCSILAHRVDGVVVKIEGNPESEGGKGRLCPKGVSGLMVHYDPNRVRVPLRRTNPEKGIGVDPGWKEISWDEALDEIAGHLKRIRADDPRKLTIERTTTVSASRVPVGAFAAAFGTPNAATSGASLHCGNAVHVVGGIMHASWASLPDFQYCNYAVYFGASKGHAAGHAAGSNMVMAADARARGMKMVVVDPICKFAAAKATEWVPIRVGTDAALALAMANVIVNELGVYDGPYLQAKTNAPYLIGPDKAYIRDSGTGTPLVWDMDAEAARPFDAVAPENMALEGAFDVVGVRCHPAFELLRNHLRNYAPERSQEITTVPAADIRRLAAEFAHEARVGSTIVIDGVTLPYRPVAAVALRGSQGHVNALYNQFSVDLLNQLVGAADVVGSCIGFNPVCHGHPETGRLDYVPSADADGLMVTGMWMHARLPYPIGEPQLPQRIGLQDLFVMGMASPFLDSTDREGMWEKFDLPYRPEMMINYGCNLVMAIANKDAIAASLAEYKFIVSFDLFVTETTAFADIVLPDCDYLHVLDSRASFPFLMSLPAGMGEWCWAIGQPVVAPQGQQRRCPDVLLDLAERSGFRTDYNAAFNAMFKLQPPYRLDGDQAYTWEEICDFDLRNNFGPERGLDWFKQHGVLKWPKKPEEVYWRPFVDARVPIYWEWMPALRDKIAAIAEPRGVPVPEAFYQPLPDWLPCPSHQCEAPEFDLYGFYYRDVLHTNSFTVENAWLDEAAQLDPFTYAIAINADTGRRKGFADGDMVRIESSTGRRIEGRVRLTEAIHPEALGFAALTGHWSDGMPVAKNKGVFYNDLLEHDRAHASPANLGLDLCVKVRISPV